MRHFATILLAGILSFSAARGSTLREQLALADEANDTHARIEIIRRILETESDDELSGQLVNLWLSVSDYDMAESALKDWKTAPPGFQAGVTAEILYNRDEKPGEAIALLAAYHGKDAADLDITRQLARFYGAQGEQRKVAALLASAPGVSGDAPLLLQRARAKRALADFDGALADFALAEKVDAKETESSKPSYERLQAALPQIKSATTRLEKNPKDYEALVARAYWYLASEAPDLARTDAETAYNLAPQSVAAAWLYARSAYSRQRALEEFSVDLDKGDPTPEVLGKLVKYDALLAAKPRDAAALIARSFQLSEASQFLLALKDAEAALAVSPSSADAHVEKIYALIKLGRRSDAAAVLPALEAAKPPAATLARASGYLADAELNAGNLDLALDYATKALKAQSSANLYKVRAAIFQRLGRVAEANDDLAKAKKSGKNP